MRIGFPESHALNLLLFEFHLHDPSTVSGQKQSSLRIKCPRFTNPQLAAPFAQQIICERLVPPLVGLVAFLATKGIFPCKSKVNVEWRPKSHTLNLIFVVLFARPFGSFWAETVLAMHQVSPFY